MQVCIALGVSKNDVFLWVLNLFAGWIDICQSSLTISVRTPPDTNSITQ